MLFLGRRAAATERAGTVETHTHTHTLVMISLQYLPVIPALTQIWMKGLKPEGNHLPQPNKVFAEGHV